jgi:flavin reductase
VSANSVEQAAPDIRAQFLDGMSRAAFCVNVVTTDGPAGRAGVTVSAMSSVSADGNSPTVLVCIHHQSRTAAAIVENSVFCVNILRDDQSNIADRFGGRELGDADKFAYGSWVEGDMRAPRLADVVVAFRLPRAVGRTGRDASHLHRRGGLGHDGIRNGVDLRRPRLWQGPAYRLARAKMTKTAGGMRSRRRSSRISPMTTRDSR